MKVHDYILMIDEIETVFEVVGELTTIKIPHKDYRYSIGDRNWYKRN